MNRPLEGITVVEVAAWTFVPAAGAVLADWGATVIKIEHPVTGDPQRGLIAQMLTDSGKGSINFMIEQPNRGKKSVGIDIGHPDGRETLLRLVERADVFLTNFLPPARRRLGIEVADIEARNPNIVYVRGSGVGQEGAEADRGGYDAAMFWARGGVGSTFFPPQLDYPMRQSAAFGDLIGAQTIAGGVAAALLQRERTGEAPEVDVSLLGVGAWVMSPDIVASELTGAASVFGGFPERTQTFNPLANSYRTRDGRYIQLVLLQSDRFWSDFCERLGHPELIADPRFASDVARAENRAECVALLDEIFSVHTLEEWKQRLDGHDGVWAPYQDVTEIAGDPQVQANGYLRQVEATDGTEFDLVANPVQFDRQPPDITRAPEHAEHTEEVLLELGLDWDQLIKLKEANAIS